MNDAKGRLTTKKSGNGGYKSAWIYIPSKIYKKDNFPFQENEEVIVEIEDESLRIIKNDERSRIIRKFGFENTTLPKLIEIKAKANKNQPYLYFKNHYYTYQDLNTYSNMIAHGLINLINDLELKSPKISLMMKNCPEYLFTWFGIAKAGCVFVPVDISLKGDILEHVLSNSDTEILIIDYEFLNSFEEIQGSLKKIRLVIIRGAPNDFDFDNKYSSFKSLNTSKSENPKINIYSEDPVEILYSEGVIGKPKGVIYRNVVIPGISLGYDLLDIGLSKVSKIFCPIPLSKGAAQIYTIIPSIFYNKSVVLSEEFNTSTFWDEIKEHKPSCFCYFGGYLTELLYRKPSIKDRIHSIQFAYGFGAVRDLWEAFEKRFGIPLYETWSHVEGIGVTFNKVGSKGGKMGSIGRPLDFLELKIVDSKANELPPGPDNIGEIIVRRKSGELFQYYKQPEYRDVRIDDNNWVYTNDFGYLDDDGYVYFKGKKNEIIFKENEIICVKDIEQVANLHHHIIETAIIPIKDGSKLELKLTARKVKNRSITPEELSNYLYHNLAFKHVPKYIEIIDTLPKGTATEILKELLKKNWKKSINSNIWDTQKHAFLEKRAF